ncbi:MAG: ATP-binding protein [Proteobacteria bacterium]|nr:ATP-binding protein [Pseudomonadota bacterium]
MKYQENPPNAAALMTSARSFGNYDLPGAVADLIDNSIKAAARKVSITCLFNGGAPTLSIVDDGYGMSAAELVAAMRPASTNPSAERAPDDLGRFGWGMKSASFSQCRRLTVISRQKGGLSAATWDLDDIDSWRMVVYDEQEAFALSRGLPAKGDGTEILWEKCDRLSENATLGEEAFNSLVAYTRSRLELIFHKFLSGLDGAKKLTISVNGLPLEAYDPFYRSHPATQPLEKEDLPLNGSIIRISPFVLPHYSKLKLSEHDRLGGEEGFLRNQGFYLYRNHRLIIHGTWFRLAKFGELSQLVHISVDIPNSLDDVWKITVDKSDAQLPAALRKRLTQIIEKLRSQAARVYRNKGARLDRPGTVPVWSRTVRHNEIRYSVNREHPLIASILEDDESGRISAALKLVEQAFPVGTFAQDASADISRIHQTEADPRRLLELAETVAGATLAEVGDMKEVGRRMKDQEPFASSWTLIEDHFRNKGWKLV